MWLETILAFVPELTLKGTPEHVGLEYEDTWLETPDGGKAHAWWIPGPRSDRPRPTWVYFHGNGGNISARLDGYRDLHRRLGANVLAVDYRGFGLSPGRPSEEGTYADARAAVAEAKRRSAEQPEGAGPMVYLGVSMGAAVAARMALELPPDMALLESAPSSFPDLAPEVYSWTRFLPVQKIMQIRFETTAHVAAASTPMLFIHGDSDNVVPLKYGQAAYEAANDPKKMLIIKGGTHDRPDLVDPDMYYRAVNEFILEYAAQPVAVKGELRAAG